MPTGFIYVVTTVTRSGAQSSFSNVPTEWKDRLYFGPCKVPMRPRMNVGDYIFGVSPANPTPPPRRILFVGQIEERIKFADAYRRFPDLRGNKGGPIHVRPISGSGSFPHSEYEHISEANHSDRWAADLRTRELDCFFVCRQSKGWLGCWLGLNGPEIDEEILEFLKGCYAYGVQGRLGKNTGTLSNPIAYGRQYRVHLETHKPEDLVRMCHVRLRYEQFRVDPNSASLSHSPPSAPSNYAAKRSRNCR